MRAQFENSYESKSFHTFSQVINSLNPKYQLVAKLSRQGNRKSPTGSCALTDNRNHGN